METTKVTITSVSRKEKISQKGKPFISLGLKTNEYGEKWLSGFGNKANESWKVGDTVEVIVKPNGEYLNFEMPKPGATNSEELQRIFDNTERILNYLVGLKIEVAIIKENVVTKKTRPPVDYPENTDEPPFPMDDDNF